MGYLLFLFGWIVCGLLAVFVLGLIERFGHHSFDDQAPLACFLGGPITLFMLLAVESLCLMGRAIRPILDVVQSLGRGE